MNHHCKMSLNQSNVQIQRNLYQNSNDIVHRARNPKLGVVMDTYPSIPKGNR